VICQIVAINTRRHRWSVLVIHFATPCAGRFEFGSASSSAQVLGVGEVPPYRHARQTLSRMFASFIAGNDRGGPTWPTPSRQTRGAASAWADVVEFRSLRWRGHFSRASPLIFSSIGRCSSPDLAIRELRDLVLVRVARSRRLLNLSRGLSAGICSAPVWPRGQGRFFNCRVSARIPWFFSSQFSSSPHISSFCLGVARTVVRGRIR